MMTLSDALRSLDGKAELTAEDTITLRQIIFGPDQTVSQDEAEALFKLNADAGAISKPWHDLFIEAVTDFVVHQQAPAGYVDDAKAEWLIATVERCKPIRGDVVEAVVHVLEEAAQTPARFSDFALDLVKRAMLSKIRRGAAIKIDEIQRLRRVLFAVGGEGNIAVTRREAEAVFDINDALNGAAVDPAWTELFKQAVGNAVMFESTWQPDAARVAKDEAWLADPKTHLLSGLKIFKDGRATGRALMDGAHELFDSQYEMKKAEAADEALEARAEVVTAEEAHWLEDRIGRNGGLDDNERALLAFIRENARELDPSLLELVDKLGGQAASAAA
jgi:hypothetical protein